MTAEVSVTGVWHNVPFERAEDLFERELVVGGSGATDISVMYANAANRIFSTRYKTVTGYPGNAAQMVALERGEVQGLAAWNFSSLISGRPHWLPEKKVKILLQLSVDKHPDLAHVPTLLEFARSDAQRTVGNLVFGQSRFARILFAPPGLPADRVEALRTAFETIMADPDFLAEAGKANMEINRPLNGKALAGLIDEFHAAPPELVRQAAEAMGLTVTSPPKN